jgi:hypothetical protein
MALDGANRLPLRRLEGRKRKRRIGGPVGDKPDTRLESDKELAGAGHRHRACHAPGDR